MPLGSSRKARRSGRRHARRSAEPSPVPAAAVPGGDRGPVAGGDRAAAAVDLPQAANTTVLLGRGGPHRSRGARGRALGRRPDPVRHADRRDGRTALVLRARRVGAVRARTQDDRRRDRDPAPDPHRVRGRRARGRSRAARGVDDVRARRRRADRRGARGCAGRDRERHPAPGLPLDPAAGRPDPARRGARPHPADLPTQGAPRPRRRQLEKLGVAVRTGTRVVHIDEHGVRVETPGGRRRSRPARCCGPRACSPRRSAGRSPRRPAPRRTATAGSGWGRTSRSPATPRSSCSATRPCSRGLPERPVPGVAQGGIQPGKYAAKAILRRLRGEARAAVPVPEPRRRRGHRAALRA